ncbi:MAG: GTP-binding protein [candidate division KSB1 bacterium]|nr:GTP-binding protein [candidate division KSB1 bacterium]MDZ7319427.1 GTP-binding protein [candidate division KSB1 bacterium]MDZ7340045.1 GTP-binding protein [candidate division KSB1 bacterium]
MEKQILHRKKICLLGEFGVGKTSLVRRFVYNKFEEKYLSTIGVHICHKTIIIPAKEPAAAGHQLNLILWDLAHIDKFNAMIKNYFRGANGAIVVFDLTRLQNAQHTNAFLDPFLQMNPNAQLIIAGNKVDLVQDQSASLEQLLHICKTYNAPCKLTSAKTGENVEPLFSELASQLLKVG